MKKISTRMLVSILTIVMLCSILSVGIFAADAWLVAGPYGTAISDYSTYTLTRTAFFNSAKVSIGPASGGWAKLCLVNESKLPVTFVASVEDKDCASGCSRSLPYLFSYKSKTVKLALAAVNQKYGTMQINATWNP